MPIFKNSHTFANVTTGAVAAFSLVAGPYAAHQIVDEGIFGADDTVLSESAAISDAAYLDAQMEALSTTMAEIDQLEALQGELYRQSRAGNNAEGYNENRAEIQALKTRSDEITSDIYNTIYTNRSMSESQLEDYMQRFRLNYGADVFSALNNTHSSYYRSSAEIDEDYARNIRTCQVTWDQDSSFVEPTIQNSAPIESCADNNEGSDAFSALAALLALVAVGGSIAPVGDAMHDRLINWHYRRRERKQEKKNQKLDRN